MRRHKMRGDVSGTMNSVLRMSAAALTRDAEAARLARRLLLSRYPLRIQFRRIA